jgi:hypothetical protein
VTAVTAAAAAIDWAQPWFLPLQGTAPAVAEQVAAGAPVALALNAASPSGVRFVDHGALPAGEAYEAFIARTGSVPTRDNLHDLFNGLVWLRHPALKRRLNTLQAQAIAALGVGPTRGPLRDALTLFDEHGALWPAAPAPMVTALAAHDWTSLFIGQRAGWGGGGFEVFGHALLEQLATAPRKALTAHVVTGEPVAWLGEVWSTKPFMPLPVLGVPGWWPANEAPDFYGDERVFRPHRLHVGDAPAVSQDLVVALLNLAPEP